MHAGAQVQAGVGGLALCVAQHGTPQVSKTQRYPVEDRVLAVVQEAVGHHQVEVGLQVSHWAVGVTLQLRAHSGKVHRLADELQVVGDLRTRKQNSKRSWAEGIHTNTIEMCERNEGSCIKRRCCCGCACYAGRKTFAFTSIALMDTNFFVKSVKENIWLKYVMSTSHSRQDLKIMLVEKQVSNLHLEISSQFW